MKKRFYLLGTALAATPLTALVFFLLSQPQDETPAVVAAKALPSPLVAMQPMPAMQDSLSLSEQLPATSAGIELFNVTDVAGEEVFDGENPYAAEVIKAQLMQVADMYEEASRYPVGSQPITSQEDLARYLPPSKSSVSTPFPVDGLDKPLGLALTLSQHQAFPGQTIDVELKLDNLPEGASVEGIAQLTSLGGQWLENISWQSQTQESGSARFFGQLTLDATNSRQWPVELQVAVRAEVDEHPLIATAPLKFNPPVAVLMDVGGSRQHLSELLIPLQFQVRRPGYYFVTANLYSASTQAPLVHLEAEGPLQGIRATLELKAHAQALAVGGDEGPYELRDVRIVRSAPDNEPHDLEGMSLRKAWAVSGFSLGSYDPTPPQDEFAQERLAFLRKLGQL